MLLKSAPTSDEDLFIAMSGGTAEEQPRPTATAYGHTLLDDQLDDSNDTDDVWATSAPSSPTMDVNSLSSAADTTRSDTNLPQSAHHPSDIPRLRQEHTTAGYRDGIAAAKAQSVQAGFDEGFGLGATIGMRVGRLLGLLEGIVAAVSSGEDRRGAEQEAPRNEDDVIRLWEEARDELTITSVFGSEYWNPDGTWKYDVGGLATTASGDESHDNVVFADVAASHPLLKKWDALVSIELERWGVDPSVLDDEASAVRDYEGPTPAKQKEVKAAPLAARGALQW
ncbi:hypothetical protein VTK73DRAFT_2581 [Phialemonium thermophilum]|uniref:Protein YAE1 n=1 Tax=Phialemonium thermophilum TaxID=223376 RepID=A0ABR3X3S3_9PEZI